MYQFFHLKLYIILVLYQKIASQGYHLSTYFARCLSRTTLFCKIQISGYCHNPGRHISTYGGVIFGKYTTQIKEMMGKEETNFNIIKDTDHCIS